MCVVWSDVAPVSSMESGVNVVSSAGYCNRQSGMHYPLILYHTSLGFLRQNLRGREKRGEEKERDGERGERERER